MWQYQARPIAAIDGDTIDVEIDLGFSIRLVQRVRLYGVDTPERKDRGPWAAAKQHTEVWLAGDTTGWPLRIETVKANEKYGRWLADIRNEAGESLTESLIANGHGVAYFGGART
jgi:micrococcal nuclease